jgi:hypothetical protein
MQAGGAEQTEDETPRLRNRLVRARVARAALLLSMPRSIADVIPARGTAVSLRDGAVAGDQADRFAPSDSGAGRPPRNKSLRYPAAPPVEEIVAVMRTGGDGLHGRRLRGLVVILWRAGLRIHEALARCAGRQLPLGYGAAPRPVGCATPTRSRWSARARGGARDAERGGRLACGELMKQ